MVKIITFVIFLFLIIAAVFAVNHYKNDLKPYYSIILGPYKQIYNRVSVNKPAPKPEAPSDWQPVDFQSVHLTLHIPPDWSVGENETVSQHPLPIAIRDDRIYNIISPSTHSGVLIDGYYDQDLFKILYNLKNNEVFEPEYFKQGDSAFTKLSSGKILTGEPFVVVKTGKIDPQNSNQPKIIRAFILKNNTLVILTLSYFNNYGLEMFEKIITFSKFN